MLFFVLFFLSIHVDVEQAACSTSLAGNSLDDLAIFLSVESFQNDSGEIYTTVFTLTLEMQIRPT